ncbi:MAG: SDR family oxidoreductase [Anaerolineales bacterium]
MTVIKCLVTGGAGFIGSQLVRTFLDEGYEVRVLDNFSTGRWANLEEIQTDIEVVEGDIRDQAVVEKMVQGVDVVFHQAAFVSVPLSMTQPNICFDVNVGGTVKLLTASLDADVERVVMASSAAVYGDTKKMPLREEGRLMALSPYAASKRVIELYAELYTRVFNLEVVSLRYFNVYGPRQSPDSDYAAVIPIFTQRLLEEKAPLIYGDGHQSRDFIFVEDVAWANLLALEADEAPGRAINICSGEEVSILSLLDVLQDLIPGAPPPQFTEERQGDIYRSVGSPDRAEEILGFHPQVSLRQGLKATMEWMSNR